MVITGETDLVADADKLYFVKNGHPIMGQVVGTGCMATSIIGAFAANYKYFEIFMRVIIFLKPIPESRNIFF